MQVVVLISVRNDLNYWQSYDDLKMLLYPLDTQDNVHR
ncbi:MAG: hypothetical protein JWQ63_3154 [Mucilaginibacter sp.]|nr:hypothetical protein [Mucilaginibacter sp.]